MPQVSKELNQKIVKRFIRDGRSLGGTAHKMYMNPATFTRALRTNDGSYDVKDKTYRKLVAYADGKTFEEITDPKAMLVTAKSKKMPTKETDTNNVNVILDRLVAVEMLVHTELDTIRLLKEQLDAFEKDNKALKESNAKLVEEMNTFDKRQEYKNSDFKDLKQRVKSLEIKIEPTRFKKLTK